MLSLQVLSSLSFGIILTLSKSPTGKIDPESKEIKQGFLKKRVQGKNWLLGNFACKSKYWLL